MNIPTEIPYYNLPPDSFPFVIEFFKVTDRTGTSPIHRIDVTGPGPIHIPMLADDGIPVWVRTTLANGTVEDNWP